MKQRLRALFPILFFALMLPACASGEKSEHVAPQAMMDSQRKMAPGEAPETKSKAFAPMIARSADLVLWVDEVASASTRIQTIVKGMGGYTTDSTLENGDDPRGSLTCRVPDPKLDGAIETIKGVGTARSVRVSGQDVGEEYTDLSKRLSNWRAEEARLLELYRRADKIPDLLEIERELTRVRGEIETATGRLNYLKHQVDLATINVQLSRRVPLVEGFHFPTVLGRAFAALGATFFALLSLLVWVLVFSVLWVPALLLFGWLRKLAKR